jgi:hypothetical protein
VDASSGYAGGKSSWIMRYVLGPEHQIACQAVYTTQNITTMILYLKKIACQAILRT